MNLCFGLQGLQAVLAERERQYGTCPAGRLFYLALPPSVYPQVGHPWHQPKLRRSNAYLLSAPV